MSRRKVEAYKWEVAKGKKQTLINVNTNGSWVVFCTKGKVVVVEGDMANPTPGDGRKTLTGREGQVFTPNRANELYLEGLQASKGILSST